MPGAQQSNPDARPDLGERLIKHQFFDLETRVDINKASSLENADQSDREIWVASYTIMVLGALMIVCIHCHVS